MSPSQSGWSTDPMPPPVAGSQSELQGDQSQSRKQDAGQRMQQPNQAHTASQGQRLPESPYPYYTPREGEVVWPPGSFDPSQQSYMGSGPSRIPYDPGAFTIPPESQPPSTHPPAPQSQSQTQYPPVYPSLDRAFDSGNLPGMMASSSTNPSSNIMTPGLHYSHSDHPQPKFNEHYRYDNAKSDQQPQNLQSLGFPYNPPHHNQPSIPTHGDHRAGHHLDRRSNEGSGNWPGPEYGQMGFQPGHEMRSFIPPNLDSAFYPPPFPDHPAVIPSERRHSITTSTSPHLSGSTTSITSPQEGGRQGRERRQSSFDIEDDEDWSHLPESERALAKLAKRRGQNKIAQRAFRARTRMNKAQTSTDLAHLTDLTQSQAKRLEDLSLLVATLQRENAELRMAAMSNQNAPPPATPPPATDTKPRSIPSDETIKGPGDDHDEEMDQDQTSPLSRKRQTSSRNPG